MPGATPTSSEETPYSAGPNGVGSTAPGAPGCQSEPQLPSKPPALPVTEGHDRQPLLDAALPPQRPPGKARWLCEGLCGRRLLVVSGWYHGYWLGLWHLLTVIGFVTSTPAVSHPLAVAGAILGILAVAVNQFQAQCRDPGIVLQSARTLSVPYRDIACLQVECSEGWNQAPTIHIAGLGEGDGAGAGLAVGMRLASIGGHKVGTMAEYQGAVACVAEAGESSTVRVEVNTDDAPYHRPGRFGRPDERLFGLTVMRFDWVVLDVDGDPLEVWRWCATCRLRRPPRAAHCSSSDFCVKEYDHFCPIVGTCVAQRTFRYFTAYHLWSLVLSFWILGWSAWFAFSTDWDEETTSHNERYRRAAIVLCIISASIGVCYAWAFSSNYLGMACKDTTLRERHRHLQRMPGQARRGGLCGAPRAAWTRLCAELPPSALHPAGVPSIPAGATSL
eukprot:TRINITY_DN47927_c0_g1_i1.p1 TRINITY_DN47927_c0_g1~~TRINITY_DN47927_c0_g1_i1.p1  ORF type:complete len:478 (+),score=82.77 TRINITY_DN47927_c0_g1_i1:97-1434(+)